MIVPWKRSITIRQLCLSITRQQYQRRETEQKQWRQNRQKPQGFWGEIRRRYKIRRPNRYRIGLKTSFKIYKKPERWIFAKTAFPIPIIHAASALLGCAECHRILYTHRSADDRCLGCVFKDCIDPFAIEPAGGIQCCNQLTLVAAIDTGGAEGCAGRD